MNYFKMLKFTGTQIVVPVVRNHYKFLHSTKVASCWSWPAPDAVKDPAVKNIVEKPSMTHTIPSEHDEIEYSTEEWHYVKRLYPRMKTVPIPNLKPGEITPSGYRAPFAKPGDYPYFVGRTSNFMPRVHLLSIPQEEKYKTIISGVEGDVFQFAHDLKQYLIGIHGKEIPIIVTVMEVFQKVYVYCDVTNDVKNFLFQKGF